MPRSLRWIGLVVAVGLALASIIVGRLSWHRWEHPESTAPVRLVPGPGPANPTPAQVAQLEELVARVRAEDLAYERSGAGWGLFLAALGTAGSSVLLIVFGRRGRNSALTAAGRSAALVVAIPLALSAVFAAGRVTLLNTIGPGIVAWWGVAGVCSLFSLLLWRHRERASNNRWRGP